MALAGEYRVSASTPMGERVFFLKMADDGGSWKGTIEAEGNTRDMWNIEVNGDSFTSAAQVMSPMGLLDVTLSCSVNGDALSGELMTSFMPITLTGERV